MSGPMKFGVGWNVSTKINHFLDDEINVENQFVTKNANLGALRKAVFTYQHKPETYITLFMSLHKHVTDN